MGCPSFFAALVCRIFLYHEDTNAIAPTPKPSSGAGAGAIEKLLRADQLKHEVKPLVFGAGDHAQFVGHVAGNRRMGHP